MQKNQGKTAALESCEVVQLCNQTFHLHPHAAIYWEDADTLIVADLHLGKATHFRRHGLAVPTYVQDETLEKLSGLLLDFKPRRLLMLGDLFHSDYNAEWEDFAELVMAFSHVKFSLVPGNHDRLTYHQYEKYNIEVKEEPYFEGPFAFSHHPLEKEVLVKAEQAIPSSTDVEPRILNPEPILPTKQRSSSRVDEPRTSSYNLAGHIHPAVMLQGRRDRMRLPCFFFGKEEGLLPAFGAFTGTYTIQPQKVDRVYVLTGNEVMRVG